MEKDRGGKVIAIAALLIGVIGLSVGFAAFSNTLRISSAAEYNPDNNIFNVDFSSSSSSVVDGNLSPSELLPSGSAPTGATATISNASDPTISGIKATFSEPGQSVKYTFYVKNVGELKAYLRSVTFADASVQPTNDDNNKTVGSGFKTCTQLSKTGENVVANPADMNTMAAACQNISLSLKLGDETFTAGKARSEFTVAAAHDLIASTGTETVDLVISYDSNGALADGDFTVNFGDITLVYNSTES